MHYKPPYRPPVQIGGRGFVLDTLKLGLELFGKCDDFHIERRDRQGNVVEVGKDYLNLTLTVPVKSLAVANAVVPVLETIGYSRSPHLGSSDDASRGVFSTSVEFYDIKTLETAAKYQDGLLERRIKMFHIDRVGDRVQHIINGMGPSSSFSNRCSVDWHITSDWEKNREFEKDLRELMKMELEKGSSGNIFGSDKQTRYPELRNIHLGMKKVAEFLSQSSVLYEKPRIKYELSDTKHFLWLVQQSGVKLTRVSQSKDREYGCLIDGTKPVADVSVRSGKLELKIIKPEAPHLINTSIRSIMNSI